MKDPLRWPALDWPQWQACGDTLHMLTQIVGKTRLALTPLQNHWWNVPLYVSVRGLTTSVMALPNGGRLEIEFDFHGHRLAFHSSSGRSEHLPLESRPVQDFYAAYQRMLHDLEIPVAIDPRPVEVVGGIRFDQDHVHREYDPDAAARFWQVLSAADALLKRFSTHFYGKISPVHFFWGSFDLAVTRFNGRRAPARPGADAIQAEAYSHECISAGFWPGNGGYGRPAFYSYAAPVPPGLAETAIMGPARFDKSLGEFILDYDDMRAADDPERTLLEFLQSAYSACAEAAHWDRKNLDRNTPEGDQSKLPYPQAGCRRLILTPPAGWLGTGMPDTEGEILGQLAPGTVLMMGDNPALPRMPARPRLLDFFKYRITDITCRHLLSSGKRALDAGHDEKVVLACLLHDIANGMLLRTDHGYWGAQMIAPYVDEEIAWAVENHQALRYYADESVGYRYPESYVRFFGPDYSPPEYIRLAAQAAREHRWYMSSRLVTVYDLYFFEKSAPIDPEIFTDIIGRHFREPPEGLGFDGSRVAHMWRTAIWPNNSL